MEITRPVKRLAAKVLLAASMIRQAGQVSAQPGAGNDQQVHRKPVPQVVTQDDVDAFNSETEDQGFLWFSDPASVAINPAQKSFMKRLAKVCEKMGLDFVPQIFIVGPVLVPHHGNPSEGLEVAAAEIEGNVGPYISYRDDMFGGKNPVLTEEEAIAVGLHELWHLKKREAKRLNPPPEFSLKMTKAEMKAWNEKQAADMKQEEIDADLFVVKAGYGKALYSALGKIDRVSKADFIAVQSPEDKAKGITYEMAVEQIAKRDEHETTAMRQARIANMLAVQHKPVASFGVNSK